MNDPVHPRSLHRERERTIEILCRRFADDSLGMGEFERRVDRAHAARSVEELRALVRDLPGAPEPEASTAPTAPAEPSAGMPEGQGGGGTRFLLAVMGGAERRGPWTPPDHLVVTTFMGGAELDFREALLGPGITRVTVACVMGGVSIIVPPGLAVDASGLAIMGGFDHGDAPDRAQTPDAPVLRLTGVALMGGVTVEVRLPGEDARAARRRRKQERRRRRSDRGRPAPRRR